MNIARKKYDEHLQWLRELAAKEKLPLSDVLRYVTKTPGRLSELMETPEQTEAKLIELGRTPYYEQLIDTLINVTESGIERIAENRLKKLRQESMAKAREKAEEKKKKGGAEMLAQILSINSDLLKKPRSEGWKLDTRANYIAKRVGRSESYVRKLIATPRKTKQT